MASPRIQSVTYQMTYDIQPVSVVFRGDTIFVRVGGEPNSVRFCNAQPKVGKRRYRPCDAHAIGLADEAIAMLKKEADKQQRERELRELDSVPDYLPEIKGPIADRYQEENTNNPIRSETNGSP